jgi:V/A-type H+-transporting ATPase subunit F
MTLIPVRCGFYKMQSDEIAIIGDPDTVTGFRMVGISNYAQPESPAATRQVLMDFFRDPQMGLILITEPLAKDVEETIMELSAAPVPVIMAIPDRQGPTGTYEEILRELIRKAVGIEINI